MIPNDSAVAIVPPTLEIGRAGATDHPPAGYARPELCLGEVLPWPEPVDGQALLDELVGALTRFVVLPKFAPEALALWIVHTYAFELRQVTAYVGLASPQKRCGKTTLLSLLSELVNRPVVAANISPPAFFRVIEEARPTLLIDETDTFLRGNEELRGILNAGYCRKTAFVVRVANEASASAAKPGEETAAAVEGCLGFPVFGGRAVPRAAAAGSRLATFSCWCPKAMATIGPLPETLADRCILISMQRKTPRERCERLRNLEGGELRRRCARFVLDHAAEIGSAAPAIPADLNDRAADIWEPLLVLADLAGGPWPEKGREAALWLSASAQESNPIASLLMDILLCFVSNDVDRVFSRSLTEWLAERTHRPWMEVLKGKQLNELWLARQLRPFGLGPKTIWIGDEHAKGYVKEDFTETFCRYIPQSEVAAIKAEVIGPKPGSEPGGEGRAGDGR